MVKKWRIVQVKNVHKWFKIPRCDETALFYLSLDLRAYVFYLLTAFSTFAFAEYFVAAANMGYYWTLVGDLPDEEIIVKKPCHSPLLNGHHPNTPAPSNGTNKKED